MRVAAGRGFEEWLELLAIVLQPGDIRRRHFRADRHDQDKREAEPPLRDGVVWSAPPFGRDQLIDGDVALDSVEGESRKLVHVREVRQRAGNEKRAWYVLRGAEAH